MACYAIKCLAILKIARREVEAAIGEERNQSHGELARVRCGAVGDYQLAVIKVPMSRRLFDANIEIEDDMVGIGISDRIRIKICS